MSITIRNVYDESATPIPHGSFIFKGGEPHVQLDPSTITGKYLWVDARLGTPADFMTLLATLDAVRGCNPGRLGLAVPYFPGARQDRRTPGTPLTVKLYADAIRQARPDVVVTLDPHSDVLPALLDCEVVPAHAVMPERYDYTGWICPDAGAEKRVGAAAVAHGATTIVHGRKHRDPRTGKLSGFSAEPLPGPGRYLMVDDICDGGGTFVGLLRAMRDDPHFAASKFDLFVSHGIFSKGLTELLDNFQVVYTTDSFPAHDCNPAPEFADESRLGCLVVAPLVPLIAPIMLRRIGS